MADGKIDIELNVESKSASTQAKKAVSDISKGIESGLKDVSKAAENVGKNVEKPLKSAADSAKSAFKGVGADAKSSFSGIGDAAKSASGDASSAFKSVPADAKGAFSEVSSEAKSGFDGVADAAKTAADGATDAFDGLGDQIESEFDGIGDAAENAGDDIHGVFGTGIPASTAIATAAIAAIGVELINVAKQAVSTGMEFDKAMSQVAATMGVSVKEVGELTDFAKQMGESTAFSASQAAEALNYMALAGYDAETSMRVLPTVLNLAAAGNMELAAASDMVTDAQSALGLTLDQTEIMVDQMAKTSSKTNTSVAQLGEAFLTVGGTAKNLAGGTAELSQMLGILADNGIKGAEGGTALRNVILSLSAPTDTAAAKMEELGLAVFDAEGNMRPMPEIFADLNAAMEPLTQQDKTDALNTIFNKVDLKSANALLGTSASRFSEVAVAIDDAAGSAEKMANTQLDNLAGDVTLLESATEGFFISVSDKLTPALRQLTQFGTNTLMPFLTGAVKNIDKFAPAIMAGAAAIVAMVGKAPAIKALYKAFGDLTIKVNGSTVAFKEMTVAQKASAIATQGLSKALNLLKAAAPVLAITAAVEAISLFAGAAEKASGRAKDLSKATDGIRDSSSAYQDAYRKTADSLKAAADGTENYTEKLKYNAAEADEVIRKQAELADTLNDMWSEAGTNAAMVDTYADSIARLTGRYDDNGNAVKLSAQEQAELYAAVDGLNSIMGTSYSVIDAENGILNANTSEILENADAWNQKALAEAASAANTELMKQQIETHGQLTKATDELRLATETMNTTNDPEEWKAASASVNAYQTEVDRLTDAEKAIQDEILQNNQTVRDLQESYSSSSMALREYIDNTDAWSSAMQNAEVDGDAFISKLKEMGISTQDLAAIMQSQGEEGIQGFISAYQAGGEELNAWLQEFGFSIEEAAQNTSESIQQSAQEGAQGVTEAITNEQENTTAAIDETANQVSEHIQQIVPTMGEAAAEGAAAITESVAAESENTAAAMESTVQQVGAASAGFTDVMQPPAADAAQSVTDAIASGADGAAGAAADTVSRVGSEFSQMTPDAQQNSSETMDAMVKGIQAGTPSAVSAADNVSKQVADHFSSAKDQARQAGESMSGDHFRGGIEKGRGAAVAAADEVSKQVADHFSSAKDDAYSAGYNMAQGMADGIKAGQNNVVNSAVSAVKAANAAAKSAAKESSPSKIWREIGQFMTLGAAIGITDKKKDAIDATVDVVESVNDVVSGLGKVVSDGIILDVRYGGNPLAQLTESMARGTSALSFAAMAGNTANNYNNSTQNLNFYGDYQSPDVIAREMRMQQHYGLAGEYI